MPDLLRLPLLCLGLVLLGSLTLAAPQKVTLYVAPDGRDDWSGKLEKPNKAKTDGPVATLTAARDALRAMRTAGAVGAATVLIKPGTYALTQSCLFEAADSGTAEAPVTYRAQPGGPVRLMGGTVIAPEAFSPLQIPEIVQRLPEAARGKVYVADLTALGLKDLGTFPSRYRGAPAVPELFFNDERMSIARWPNAGWAKIAKIHNSGSIPRAGDKTVTGGVFEYSEDSPSRWKIEEGVWLQGYWCFDWFDETIQVKALDPVTKQITLAQPTVYGVKQGNPSPRRYKALNVLEELDQPGEYYMDRKSGKLYFWPPDKLAGARIVVSTLNAPLLLLKDASHLIFRGLTLENGLGDGMQITGGEGNRVQACEVRNLRTLGINISGGKNHHIEACDVHHTGTGGIVLEGGDRKTLTPCGHEAVNCHVWAYSQHQLTYANAFLQRGVGTRIANCLIHDAPHQAIGVHGNDHIFEYNVVYNICTETDDCGAYYKGRNPSCRGNIVRYNFFHNIGSPMGHGNAAVYFDDGDGGDFVIGNLFFRCGDPGRGSFGTVFSHGGFDLLARDNVFIECKRPLGSSPWPYKRYMDFLKESDRQRQLLQEVDITSELYVKRYPELAGFMTMPETRVRVSQAQRNVLSMCGSINSGNWQVKPEENWITEQDPGFVNAARGDFRMRKDAPVYKQLPGFEAPPFEKMGLYKDELRPTLPVRKWSYPPPQQLPPLNKSQAAAMPAKAGTPPVFKVQRTTAPIAVDGVLSASEWPLTDAARTMPLAQDVSSTKVPRQSRAWLAYDDKTLYVAVENDIHPDTKLAGNQWGSCEAVEIALQVISGEKKSPITVVRGYPNGHLAFGKTPNGNEEPLTMEPGEARFMPGTPQKGRWVAEFSLPLNMLEINLAQPQKLAFNISVRKVMDDLWLMWEGTQAHTYEVGRAGFIELEK